MKRVLICLVLLVACDTISDNNTTIYQSNDEQLHWSCIRGRCLTVPVYDTANPMDPIDSTFCYADTSIFHSEESKTDVEDVCIAQNPDWPVIDQDMEGHIHPEVDLWLGNVSGAVTDSLTCDCSEGILYGLVY